VFAQALAIMAVIPTLAVSAVMIAAPMLLSLLLVARFGRETRGSDLRDLDPDGHVFDKSGL
jgi:putative MFS transporter